MNLEQKFLAQGTPYYQPGTRYTGVSKQVPLNVFNSRLDLNGVSLVKPYPKRQTTLGLSKSQLDLNGKRPIAYLDNLPQ